MQSVRELIKLDLDADTIVHIIGVPPIISFGAFKEEFLYNGSLKQIENDCSENMTFIAALQTKKHYYAMVLVYKSSSIKEGKIDILNKAQQMKAFI